MALIRQARCGKRQMAELINRIFADKSLVNGNQCDLGVMGKWEEMVNHLNGMGPAKSVRDWQECYKLVARRAKTKARKIRTSLSSTGGGEGIRETLNPLEEKIIAIEGEEAVYGINLREAGFPNVQVDDLSLPGEPPHQNEDLYIELQTLPLPGTGRLTTPPPPGNGALPRGRLARERPRARRFLEAYTMASQAQVDAINRLTEAMVVIGDNLGAIARALQDSGDRINQ